jgi:formate-dependent nitrite reductase membrane component NrfD
MLKVDSFAKRVPSAIWQYALAVVRSGARHYGCAGAYTTLRTPLFYIAIISSAWFGGMGLGLLASALSMLAMEYYFA